MAQLKEVAIGTDLTHLAAYVRFVDVDGHRFDVTIGQPNLDAVIVKLQEVAREIRTIKTTN